MICATKIGETPGSVKGWQKYAEGRRSKNTPTRCLQGLCPSHPNVYKVCVGSDRFSKNIFRKP
jgi:hypothetical protein